VLPRRLKAGLLGTGVMAATAGAFVAVGVADPSHHVGVTSVPTANQRATGYSPASRLSPELAQVSVAQGATKLENPSGIVSFYGYENDVPSADNPALPQMLPAGTPATEAQKTEPDKNTYLILRGSGPDNSYDYGSHFLFQGHENAAKNAAGQRLGYLTRINLDADAQHRVTLMATQDTSGKPLATIDGSSWDPFARRLILTTESNTAPTYAATADYPSTVEDVSGALGRGGYEGVQSDSDGNLWLVEDIGGVAKGGTAAKVPNSFVYRYVPRHPGDLHDGRLEALQVLNSHGDPITVESQQALNAPDQVALHSYGNEFDTRWVTIHDTASDGNASFDANAAAKSAHATPFKRPENGVFRPGSKFTQFFFDETGDTSAISPENSSAGGWGGIQELSQSSASAGTGKLRLFYSGDQAHTGLDNIAFFSRDSLSLVEDAGDTLHGQRNGLDSAFVWDVTHDYSKGSTQPIRWLAEGRDASATIDAANGGFGKNDGDNEITGLHVSDGDASTKGILGVKIPTLFKHGWRAFYTQQHGDNNTYEVIRAPRARGERHSH
jgi:hypothetical protein